MLTIHMGILESEYPAFEAQFERLATAEAEAGSFVVQDRPRTEQDLWEAWGSPATSEDDYPMHVCIRTTMPMQDLNFIASRFQSFLIKQEQGIAEGLRLALTDLLDYDKEYVEYRW